MGLCVCRNSVGAIDYRGGTDMAARPVTVIENMMRITRVDVMQKWRRI